MLVVTNRVGYFRNPKLEQMAKGKSEYEWRTDEAIIIIMLWHGNFRNSFMT